jgi:hypothetical protein
MLPVIKSFLSDSPRSPIAYESRIAAVRYIDLAHSQIQLDTTWKNKKILSF